MRKEVKFGPVVEEVEEEVEVVDHVTYISGEYLSAACNMIAWQFMDSERVWKKEELQEFTDLAAELLRQHCPLAYSYFFQNVVGDNVLPTGTIDIIITHIRQHQPLFMGGRNSGIILP